MLRPTDLAAISHAQGILEREFSAKWLKRKSASRPSHPAPRWWKTLLDTAKAATDSGSEPNPTTELIAALAQSSVVEQASLLRGYRDAISQRLKGVGFEKALYEMQVAQFGVDAGGEVAFVVPVENVGQRNADLNFAFDRCNYVVECKKKDRYFDKRTADELWPELQDGLDEILKTTDDSYEVFVVTSDRIDAPAVPSILECVRHAVTSQVLGVHKNRDLRLAVSVKKMKLPGPTKTPGLFVPKRLQPATAWADIKQTEDGYFRVDRACRMGIYAINAHRLSSVIQSFDAARRQIPKVAKGLVYIDVDSSKIEPEHFEMYLHSVGSIVANQFTPSDNTRIAGAVVTMSVPVFEQGVPFPIPGILCIVCRNPHCEGTEDWPIPVAQLYKS